MAVTDADALAEVQWRLLEDAGFSSTLWTTAEIYARFNERQNRFNRETFLLLAIMPPIVGVAGTAQYALPDDWIATQRVSWRSAAGAYSSMHRMDRFQAAMLASGATRPLTYDDTSAGQKTIEVAPAPQTNGTLNLLYACVLETLGFGVNPDIFDIPDDFVPYVVYGVLEDLFSKDGRARNLPMAAYCRDRWDEGVALAGMFLAGWA